MRAPAQVLVTGSSGFLGRPLVAALIRSGIGVTALDLLPAAHDAGCQSVVGDVADPDLVDRLVAAGEFDTIVHAGGISGPMLARDAPLTICTANVFGTAYLLEAARTHRVARVVHCGSAAAFGHTPPAPVPDDAPLNATGLYAATKGAADLLVRAYRHDYGLDAVSLRISNAYGPGRRTQCAVRTMITDALAGRPTAMTWGRGYGRSYLYVDDAVAAIMAAVLAPTLPQWCYNVAGSDFSQMQDIADLVTRLVPGASISMQDGVDGLGYRREALDLSAARRDLGWAPQYPIARGVAAYVDWLRTQPM